MSQIVPIVLSSILSPESKSSFSAAKYSGTTGAATAAVWGADAAERNAGQSGVTVLAVVGSGNTVPNKVLGAAIACLGCRNGCNCGISCGLDEYCWWRLSRTEVVLTERGTTVVVAFLMDDDL